MERARLMHRIADETRKVAEEGGILLCYENGKALAGAIKEFNDVADIFDYYAGLTDKLEGKTIPVANGILDYTVLEPYGVSAHIIPWNYPLAMIGRSLACSMATANSTIIKTPELTPLAATVFAQALEKADIPAGIVNIICGYGNEAGEYLVSHPDVNHVVFTGSVATGKKYYMLLLIKQYLRLLNLEENLLVLCILMQILIVWLKVQGMQFLELQDKYVQLCHDWLCTNLLKMNY